MTLYAKNSSMNVEVPFKKSKVQDSLYFKEETVCPECGSKLETDSGRAELSCVRCGLVAFVLEHQHLLQFMTEVCQLLSTGGIRTVRAEIFLPMTNLNITD